MTIDNVKPETSEFNLENILDQDYVTTLRKVIDNMNIPAILCVTDTDNPFDLIMTYCNSHFTSCFHLKPQQVKNREYSFLFRKVDISSISRNQIQFSKLQKSIKNLAPTSVIIDIGDIINNGGSGNFRINFNPGVGKEEQYVYSIMTFMQLKKPIIKDEDEESPEKRAITNLEQALQSERLMRTISDFVISDNSVNEIAENIGRIICSHFKIDRCIIHDYKDGKTGFVSEYHGGLVSSMIGNKTKEDLEDLGNYVNFQKRVYDHGEKIDLNNNVVIFEDINNNCKSPEIEDLCKKYDIKAQISIITVVGGNINGGIYFHSSVKRDWFLDEISLIENMAGQLAIAIDRSHVVEKVILANNQLLEKTLELRKTLKEEKRIRQMQNEFVAMVSHEFKTPLQIIDSTREVVAIKLKKFAIEDLSVDKYLIKIKNAISRLNSLIQSTLNLSRIEMNEGGIEPELQDFGIKNLISEIVDKNYTLASEKSIQVLSELENLPDFYRGDPKMLDHCFTNVITNAIKYSKNNFPIKIVGDKDENNIFIKVIDSGIGIPKEDLGNVGRKFFRARNTLAVSGTGIGLYLTKYFIELHHGSMTIESVVDVGTTVTIKLPIIKKEHV